MHTIAPLQGEGRGRGSSARLGISRPAHNGFEVRHTPSHPLFFGDLQAHFVSGMEALCPVLCRRVARLVTELVTNL